MKIVTRHGSFEGEGQCRGLRIQAAMDEACTRDAWPRNGSRTKACTSVANIEHSR